MYMQAIAGRFSDTTEQFDVQSRYNEGLTLKSHDAEM
jgi:hypothetical protein